MSTQIKPDLRTSRELAIQKAHTWITKHSADYVFLDTETTGFKDDDEVIQVGIVDQNGKPVVDTLVKPTKPIENTKHHGFTDEDVKDAPDFGEVYLQITTAVKGKLIVAYNLDYDLRLLNQSAAKYDLAPVDQGIAGSLCVMKLFAQYFGEWNEEKRDWRWQRQGMAERLFNLERTGPRHRAVPDAQLTRKVLHAIAGLHDDPMPDSYIARDLDLEKPPKFDWVSTDRMIALDAYGWKFKIHPVGTPGGVVLIEIIGRNHRQRFSRDDQRIISEKVESWKAKAQSPGTQIPIE